MSQRELQRAAKTKEIEAAILDDVDEDSFGVAHIDGVPPSQKQIRYLNSLAEEVGASVPEHVLHDKFACSQFIDELVADGAGRRLPSAKQLDFASWLAHKMGVIVPDEAKTDSKLCSAFIDEQMMLEQAAKQKSSASGEFERSYFFESYTRGGVFGPSEKQLDYARSLSERSGQPIPESALQDRRACSEYIDGVIEEMGTIPPSEKALGLARFMSQRSGVPILPVAYTDSKACSEYIDLQKAAVGNAPSDRQ